MLRIGVHRARFNAFEDLVQVQDAQLSFSLRDSAESAKGNMRRLAGGLNASPDFRLASACYEGTGRTK